SWQPLTLVVDAKARALRPPRGEFVELAIGGPPGEERLAALLRDGAVHGVLLLHPRTRRHSSVGLPPRASRPAVEGRARVWVAGDAGVLRLEGDPLPLPYRPQAARFEPEHLVPAPPRVAWPPAGALPIPGLGDGVFGLAIDGETLLLLGGRASRPL